MHSICTSKHLSYLINLIQDLQHHNSLVIQNFYTIIFPIKYIISEKE